MAFTVQLFNFTKKENSTARPESSSATSFSCILKKDSGILNPIIELDIGISNSPARYNYAYIPEFGRYYWIEEWTNIHPLWRASLKVDTLATYKGTIGDTELYILRASRTFDGNITDSLYPTKTNPAIQINEGTAPFIHDSSENINILTGGVFVIGVVGKGGSGYIGSIKYYVMRASAFATLLQQLIDNTIISANGFNMDVDTGQAIYDASLALQKALIDPFQFIKSCVWLPILYEQFTESEITSFNIWDWPISATAKAIDRTAPYLLFSSTFAINKHPQTSSRGNFVNTSPFTILTLDIPPFPIINIDTTITANATQLRGDILIDICTGEGVMRTVANSYIINKINTQIGVPIQLSQITRDLTSPAGLVSIVGEGLGSLIGNEIGGQIASASRALTQRLQSMGANGNFANLRGRPRLYHEFFSIVDDDNEHNGRPFCQVQKPGSMGGYMVVQDGDVPINGTSYEMSEIRRYLEGGFYYE